VLIFNLTADCETDVLPLLLTSSHPMIAGLDTERNGGCVGFGRAGSFTNPGQNHSHRGTGKLKQGVGAPFFARMGDNAVQWMPTDTVHRIMTVNLNVSKSMETDVVVGLQLTDAQKNKPDTYTLQVRKGILEVDPPSPSVGQLVITADSLTWRELVLAKLDPGVAVADGRVVISRGTPDSFYAFMDLFEQRE
jgi:hypothetical protein